MRLVVTRVPRLPGPQRQEGRGSDGEAEERQAPGAVEGGREAVRGGRAGGAPAEACHRDRGVGVTESVVIVLAGEMLLADQEDVVSASSQRRDHFDAKTPLASASIPLRPDSTFPSTAVAADLAYGPRGSEVWVVRGGR
jgi:hypothetical protein